MHCRKSVFAAAADSGCNPERIEERCLANRASSLNAEYRTDGLGASMCISTAFRVDKRDAKLGTKQLLLTSLLPRQKLDRRRHDDPMTSASLHCAFAGQQTDQTDQQCRSHEYR
jgi:hypothetical protein